jgi:hypothetical protein
MKLYIIKIFTMFVPQATVKSTYLWKSGVIPGFSPSSKPVLFSLYLKEPPAAQHRLLGSFAPSFKKEKPPAGRKLSISQRQIF